MGVGKLSLKLIGTHIIISIVEFFLYDTIDELVGK